MAAYTKGDWTFGTFTNLLTKQMYFVYIQLYTCEFINLFSINAQVSPNSYSGLQISHST